MWFEQLVSKCTTHLFTLITTILYTIWTTQSLFFLLMNTFYQFIMFCFTSFWNVPCQTCDKDAFFCPACLFFIFLLILTWEKDEKSCFCEELFCFVFYAFLFFLALFYDDCFSNMKFIILNFAAVFLFFCFPLFLVTPSPIDPLSVRPSSSLFFLSPALFSNTLLISRVMVQMFYIIISN